MLHGALHGFKEVQGTGAATLEAKLTQHMARLKHKPLFQFLLDVRKSYESLDRGALARNLEGLRAGSEPRPATQELMEAA